MLSFELTFLCRAFQPLHLECVMAAANLFAQTRRVPPQCCCGQTPAVSAAPQFAPKSGVRIHVSEQEFQSTSATVGENALSWVQGSPTYLSSPPLSLSLVFAIGHALYCIFKSYLVCLLLSLGLRMDAWNRFLYLIPLQCRFMEMFHLFPFDLFSYKTNVISPCPLGV